MSRLRKRILTTVVVAVVAASVAAPVQAQTIADLQAQISALLAQITALSAQIADLGGAPAGVSGIPAGFTFDTNLSQGSSSKDVMYLQMALNVNSDTQLAASGVGSAGSETEFFGPLTRAAAVKYQEKFTSDILTPVGLSSGTGFVGPSTRTHLNGWIGSASPPPGGGSPPPGVPGVTGNTLQVTLAADTPAASSLASNGNANFTKFFLTAGDQEVTVSKILVTRQGFTANADLENVKILDANGVPQGSIGSFNVNNKASLTFSPNLKVPAGQSDAFWIRAGFISSITAGKTASLGIDSGSDVTSSADSVTGTPVFGNDMTAVALTIGSLNIDEQGATVDSQPDVGDTDVVVNNFRAAAGSTEGVTIDQITVMESGSASLSDTGNIELFDVTNNVSLGTVVSWDSGGKASWSGLNIVVEKGKTQRFKVQLDILDGPGLAVNADLIDGSDVLISVKGNTYGFFITPAIDSSWNGLGNSNQNIQSGSLTIAKSTNTPATGNIAAGDDQKLATFDFIVKGEEMRITAMTLDMDITGITFDEITSVRFFDADDNIVAGPVDCVTAGGCTVSYTDTFIAPVGTNEYSVVANIANAATTGDTVDVAINTPATMTVRGLTSNDTVTPTPATAVRGNTMTVAAGALAVTNLTTPAARSISQGINDFIFATFSMDANSSGEDVQVTVISVQDNPGAGATAASADELNNVEIWADLTSANSSRGDVYETRIADPTDFTVATMGTTDTIAFTLNQTVTVALNSFVRAAVVADLDTGASDAGTHTVDISAVTANGADTGETVTVSAPGGAGQAMTTTTGGTLTLTIDSSEPNASLVAGGDQAVLGIFRLAADNVEDLDLDSIALTVTNGGRVSTYFFYQGSTLLGSRPSGTTPSIEFTDGTVTIPANDKVLITVKGDMEAVTLTSQNNTGIQMAMAAVGDVGTTGLASGATVTSSQSNVDANTHTLFESYPTFSVNSGTPSGDLIPGSNTLLAIFDVTAHANEDVTFQDGDNNTLTIQISQSVTTSNGVTTETWRLRDSAGVQLASTTVDTFDAALVVFDFASQDFNVPGGQTKSLYVYGDTSELNTNGDVIQVWLDDGAATNIDWGIDGTGNYNHADIIFRGDIFAGSLVNPS